MTACDRKGTAKRRAGTTLERMVLMAKPIKRQITPRSGTDATHTAPFMAAGLGLPGRLSYGVLNISDDNLLIFLSTPCALCCLRAACSGVSPSCGGAIRAPRSRCSRCTSLSIEARRSAGSRGCGVLSKLVIGRAAAGGALLTWSATGVDMAGASLLSWDGAGFASGTPVDST